MKCRARVVTNASPAGFYGIKIRTSDGDDYRTGVVFDSYSTVEPVVEAINSAYAAEGRLLGEHEEDALL